MSLNQKFIQFATKAQYTSNKAIVPKTAICFIVDTGEIIKNGKSYGGYSNLNSYLPLTGGTMTGNITFSTNHLLQWSRNTDFASISFKNDSDSDSDSYMLFKTGDNGNEYFKWQSNSGGTLTDWLTLKSDGLRFKNNIVYHAGNIPTWNQNTTGNAATVTNGVYTNTAQSITAKKTFTVQQAFTATGTSPFTVSSTTAVANLNADMLDGYHANNILNASKKTLSLVNTSKPYIKVATITISGTSLAMAGCTFIMTNRECITGKHALVNLAIRRNTLTSGGATVTLVVTDTGTSKLPLFYLKSNDNVTFILYMQAEASSGYVNYYSYTPINIEGSITFSNEGVDSMIAGSTTNVTSTNGTFARALYTPRTIWGQQFDGTGNVSGAISGATTITSSSYIRASGELQSLSPNSLRIIYGSYGVFWRNDGANHFLMTTAANDQYGGYNSLRPFSFNLTTGRVSIGNGLTVSTDITAATSTISGSSSIGGNLKVNGVTTCGSGTNTIPLIVSAASGYTMLDLRIADVRKGSLGYNGEYVYIINRVSGKSLFNRDNGTLTWDGGNVGIGTTTPAYKLDVNGTFRSSGTSTLSNVNVSGDFTVNSNNLLFKSITSLENVNPQYWILCPYAANNDVLGTLYLNRTSGLYRQTKIDVHISSNNSAIVAGFINVHQIMELTSDAFELVTLTYAGSKYMAIRITTNGYPSSNAYFTGMIKVTSVENRFKAVQPSDVSDVALYTNDRGKTTINSSEYIFKSTPKVGSNLLYHAGNNNIGTSNTHYAAGNHTHTNYSTTDHTHTFASLTSKPTTATGYGIQMDGEDWNSALSNNRVGFNSHGSNGPYSGGTSFGFTARLQGNANYSGAIAMRHTTLAFKTKENGTTSNWYYVYHDGNRNIGTGATNYASGDHKHGLLSEIFSKTFSDTDADSTTFRTTVFGSSSYGFNIKVARWNTKIPVVYEGMSNHGTSLNWSGSDTHGFIAIDYSAANARIGGGSGDKINWTKRLAFTDSNITGNSATATKLANIPTTFNGKYPVTVNVNGNIYSHTGLQFEGSTGMLTATTFNGSLSGNASTATALTTNAGSSLTPVYFSGGKPVACSMSASGARWGRLTTVGGDGVMEIGKYLDFHDTNGSTGDYSARITAASTGLTLSGTTVGTFSGNLTGNATTVTNGVYTNTNQTISGVKTFSSRQVFSVASGTAPFTVNSSTIVSNLNSDMLDGLHSSSFIRKWSIHSGQHAKIMQLTRGNEKASLKLSVTYSSNSGVGCGADYIIRCSYDATNAIKTITLSCISSYGADCSTSLTAVRIGETNTFDIYVSAVSGSGYFDFTLLNCTSTFTINSYTASIVSVLPASTYTSSEYKLFGRIDKADKLGTTSIGSSNRGIYLNGGVPTVMSSTIGSSTLPVYMNSGTITQCGNSLAVSVTGSSASCTGNAASATKLATSRTLWGQNFDGTANVSGNISGIGNLVFSSGSQVIQSGTNLAVEVNGGNYIFRNTDFKPYDSKTGTLNLGTSSARWNGIYGNTLSLAGALSGATTGAFSSNITVGGTIVSSGRITAPMFYSADSGKSIEMFASSTFGKIQTRGSVPLLINPEGNNVGIGTTTPAYKLDVNGNFRAANEVIASSFGISNTSATSGKGLSLYGGATTGAPTYGMMFAGTATFGKHGGVTSDWATYLTMSDTTTRGWIFRRGSTNVASISGDGKLQCGSITCDSITPTFANSGSLGKSSLPWSNVFTAGLTVSGNVGATGKIEASSFYKRGVSDNYVLLAGGGHKAIRDFYTGPKPILIIRKYNDRYLIVYDKKNINTYVTRVNVGEYLFEFRNLPPESLPVHESYFFIAQGLYTDNHQGFIKCTIQIINNTSIKVLTSDDSTLNDGDFELIMWEIFDY